MMDVFKYGWFVLSGKGFRMFDKWTTEREKVELGLTVIERLEMIAEVRSRIDTMDNNETDRAILRVSFENKTVPFDIDLIRSAFRFEEFAPKSRKGAVNQAEKDNQRAQLNE